MEPAVPPARFVAFPVKSPTKLVDVTEFKPAIVVAEFPKSIEVVPMVMDLLAN